MNPNQHTSEAERQAHRLRNGILSASALLALLLSIAPEVPNLRGVLGTVAGAAPGWLLLAVLLELASCLGYVAILRLVLPEGPARHVRWLAWAEMAFGAAVPLGGAGGLAVEAWAMRAWGMGWSRIANRSAVILLVTTAVNLIVLALAGIGLTAGLGAGNSLALGLLSSGVALATLVSLILLPRLIPQTAIEERHGRLSRSLRRGAAWAGEAEAILRKPDWRQLGNIGYLVFDIAALWACLRAMGTNPPLPALAVSYQLGYLATVIPIPAGVGVLEAGLIGALLLCGLPPAQTAAGVLLYHAIALWVPAIGGTVGFTRLRRALTQDDKARALPVGSALILRSSDGATLIAPQPQWQAVRAAIVQRKLK
jgi:uncharacterized membrane protein YbhN (UPF0104 family)